MSDLDDLRKVEGQVRALEGDGEMREDDAYMAQQEKRLAQARDRIRVLTDQVVVQEAIAAGAEAALTAVEQSRKTAKAKGMESLGDYS